LIGPATQLLNLVNDTIIGWNYLFGNTKVSAQAKELKEMGDVLMVIRQTMTEMENTKTFNPNNSDYLALLAGEQEQLNKIQEFMRKNKEQSGNMGKRLPGGGGDGKARSEQEKNILSEIKRIDQEAADEYSADAEARWKATVGVELEIQRQADESKLKLDEEYAQKKQTREEKAAEEHQKFIDDSIEQYKRADKEKQEATIRSIDTILSSSQSMTNSLMALSDMHADQELKNLDKQHLGKKQYDKKAAAIEAERSERNRKYARIQQVLMIAEAIASTAKGVVTSLSGPPIYKWVEAAAVAAAGAAQIAVISAQKFQTGRIGDFTRSRQNDTIPAILGRGESVISAPQTAMHRDLLQSIQNNTANTASGLRGIKGQTTMIFNNPSNDVVTEIVKSNQRLNRTGTLL